MATGFECMGVKSHPLVTTPVLGGYWEPHISVQTRGAPNVWGHQHLD